MRKFLEGLSNHVLHEMSLRLGKGTISRKGQLDHIIESAKAYRWNIDDLKAWMKQWGIV